jgi:hypothetical protein
MHLSCVEINTISKWTKWSFHLTHNTLEVHRVWPKRLLCPWYIWRKPCTYLTPRLTLRCPIRYVHNDLWAYGPFGTKPCTYLASRLTLSLNRLKWASIWPTWPRTSTGCTQNDFHARSTFAQPLHLSYAEINTISKWNATSLHLTHIT